VTAYDLAPIAARIAERGAVTRYATDGRDMLTNDPDGWEVERPQIWWTGGPEEPPDWGGGGGYGGPWGNPPPNAVGSPVYGLAALPAVTRCTSLISDTIAGAPWRVRRGWEILDAPAWILDPQALRIDQRIVDPERVPEVRLSRVEFWSQWVTAALWMGDGFVYAPVRDDNGAPRPPMWQLHPLKVAIDNGRYFVGEDGVELEPGSVIHLRGHGPFFDGRGWGVLTRHAEDIGLGIAVRGYAYGTFHSGVPSGYLKVNATGLTKDQATDLRRQWMRHHGNGRRSIAVLNSTVDFNPIFVSPLDAQLDRQREWSLRDIAIAFGVPAWFLGVPGDSSTYANVESRMNELRSLTHLPWVTRIESCLDAQFPHGTGLKLNLDAILRADTKGRFEAYAIALKEGWMTIDEVRAIEDLPPLDYATPHDVAPDLPQIR
jgi:HK97 family phage portal protein